MSDGTESRPRRVDACSGTVVAAPVGTGSKSERPAVWIETAQGRYLLRRHGGPSHGDAALDRYVGRQVLCWGFIVGGSLLAERIDVVEPAR